LVIEKTVRIQLTEPSVQQNLIDLIETILEAILELLQEGLKFEQIARVLKLPLEIVQEQIKEGR